MIFKDKYKSLCKKGTDWLNTPAQFDNSWALAIIFSLLGVAVAL